MGVKNKSVTIETYTSINLDTKVAVGPLLKFKTIKAHIVRLENEGKPGEGLSVCSKLVAHMSAKSLRLAPAQVQLLQVPQI